MTEATGPCQERAELLDEVVSNLRACLLSAKGGVSFSELNNDYKRILGENIPFRKLGYPSLDELLNNIPGLLITRKVGDWNVAAEPTEDSVHLTKMIARQKSGKSKKRSKGMFSQAITCRRPTTGSWKPPVDFTTAHKTVQAKKNHPSSHRVNHKYSNSTSQFCFIQQKSSPSLLNKPPRYMLPNPGIPQTPPSNRLSSHLTANTSTRSTFPNPGNSQASVVAYKNQAAFITTENQNEKALQHTSTPLTFPVNKTNTILHASPNSEATTAPRNLEERVTQIPKPQFKTVSERLVVKPKEVPIQQTVILSPLSPNQFSADTASSITSPRTPTSPKPQITWPPTLQNQDPCKELELWAKAMNLPDVDYKIVSWTLNRRSVYSCRVKVGTDSYTSYPEESPTREEATRVAAAKAMKQLLEKTGPLGGLSQTVNKNLIRDRILHILTQHEAGVFLHQISNYYKELYKENLPNDWENAIDGCAEISKDKWAQDITILSPFVPRNEFTENEKTADPLSPRMEKIQLTAIGPPQPGILEPPTDEYWDVCITNVVSTIEIWARLIGDEYSERFDRMLDDFDSYYNELSKTPGNSGIKPGSYYAVHDEGCWHRVKCFEMDVKTGKASIFFIDHGDETSVDYTKLYPLESRFSRVPAQAINLCLADLEEFSETDQVFEYLNKLLLDQMLIAQVVSHGSKEGEIMASVVLYDTKHEVDINLNELLLSRISQNILSPKLNQEDRVSEVFVSHVTDTGDVFLHVKNESMLHLTNLMNKVINTGLKPQDIIMSEEKKIEFGRVYFARAFEDGKWYRGLVTNVDASNRIEVFTVDFGKTIVVDNQKDLLRLDQLSEVLAKYPYQALKVRLHGIPNWVCNYELAKKLRALAPPNEQVIARVRNSRTQSTPVFVELFKRLEPNNILMPINNTLIVEPELTGAAGDGNNNTQPRKRLERTVSRHGITSDGEGINKKLKPPKIPDVGSYFDVHVTMAANPGIFTVQPYEDRVYLEALMVQLQEVCINSSGPSLSSESVTEGNLYAAKHFDGHYYRVCVSKVIAGHMATVYFCDFGDFSVLSLDKLLPLGRQFLDLPYQAIRARLVGVQPLNIDWSVDDCLLFQDMVIEKDFVSIVVDSGPDRRCPGETILGLKLIDTSGLNDVYIDELLITKGCAKAAE
ncbi:tudor domain-containing protein 7-like isoform X1 [Athalia rosae]|uniref:tudor domain-containing protein 7-like isoform X1 n=1 Tax=Athalia rosae TaxID=37344 RepID=UPI0020345F13|nr:tudor domain-containing protein 7-like isoform X1 [Athalia rosae]XP_012254026.2 tudor domain-containing protein 7-like isoform X1 [Athalia rosae]